VLAMADVSWEDNADGDTEAAEGDYEMTPDEEAAAIAEGLLPDLLSGGE